MMGDIAIRISDIHVTFGDHKVLKGASGLIRKGSIVTFLGRNGCGKSTLLKAVTGNLKPDKGSVEIAGKPRVPTKRMNSHASLLSCRSFMRSRKI